MTPAVTGKPGRSSWSSGADPYAWLARDKNTWCTAYHEAGHAFVGHLMRHLTLTILTRCTIECEPGEGLDGKCSFAPSPLLAACEQPAELTNEQWQSVISLDAEARVRVLLAGEMAQFIYAKESVTEGQSADDLCKARVVLGYIAKEGEIECRMQKLRTEAALVLLTGWQAVKRIAASLVEYKTLTGADVATIIEAARARGSHKSYEGNNA